MCMSRLSITRSSVLCVANLMSVSQRFWRLLAGMEEALVRMALAQKQIWRNISGPNILDLKEHRRPKGK